MTSKPPILYQGKTVVPDEPGKVIVNFFENNQQILIKLKYFHYEVMLKLIGDTPRKALNYARENGVIVDKKVQTRHVINIEDGLKIEDRTGE